MNPPHLYSYTEAGNRGFIDYITNLYPINPLSHLFPRLMPDKD